MVEKVEMLRSGFRVSYARLLPFLAVCYSTYRRWRDRVVAGVDPIKKPGPQPVMPLDFTRLQAGLATLTHTGKRSFGVGRLRSLLEGAVSRRDMDELITFARKTATQAKKEKQAELTWKYAGTAWGMDCFTVHTPLSKKYHVLSIQDMASQYKLPPLCAEQEPKGQQIAEHLDNLFKHYDRPLFLKRDNGANLNESSVNELLAQGHVLPLNSPCYYPKYNGAIEHAQGEYKRLLESYCTTVRSYDEMAIYVDLATHQLNHLSRRRLCKDTSCKRYYMGEQRKYSKRERKEVFLWIYELALDIVEKAENAISTTNAWRIACKMWLVKNGLLFISKNGKVLPYSQNLCVHK